MKNLNQSLQDSKKDWALLPYNLGKVGDKYLMVSILGGWDLISQDEYKKVSSLNLKKGTNVFKRLKDKGLIIESNVDLDCCIDDYRCSNLNLFVDIGLHIVVLTNRCNLRCDYCQTNNKRQNDMSKEVASKVLEIVHSQKTPNLTIEFQGGEPLLNWDTLRFIVDHTQKYNMTDRKIRIALVSNFTLMDEEKFKFLIDNGVNLCTSLDGPKRVHDKNRKTLDGSSSYDKVIYWIDRIKKEYRKRNIKNKSIGLLPTITKHSLPFYKDVIDEYVKLGQASIALRSTNRLGLAKKKWAKIGYSTDEFINFWEKSMDYILELNKKGVFLYERIAYILLRKILKKEDPGYVDLCSPCGAGRSVLSYSPEGGVYTCDEARMIEEDLFKLGNVLKNSRDEIFESPVLMQTCQASLLNIWDYASPYAGWAGTCPVLNYVEQGSPVVKIAQSSFYNIQKAQIEYLFRKISKGGEDLEIFRKWVA
jgi:His-Xaa-Ser system radical SAM maturase HxsB